jgi:hypothetical protein
VDDPDLRERVIGHVRPSRSTVGTVIPSEKQASRALAHDLLSPEPAADFLFQQSGS